MSRTVATYEIPMLTFTQLKILLLLADCPSDSIENKASLAEKVGLAKASIDKYLPPLYRTDFATFSRKAPASIRITEKGRESVGRFRTLALPPSFLVKSDEIAEFLILETLRNNSISSALLDGPKFAYLHPSSIERALMKLEGNGLLTYQFSNKDSAACVSLATSGLRQLERSYPGEITFPPDEGMQLT